MNTNPSKENDLESLITPALVNRVSERVAMGIPLRIALAGEPVTRTEYKDHLLNHPELAVLQDVAKRKFLENAFSTLLEGESAAANFRWLIELVYKETIGSSEDAPEKQTVRGLSNEMLERMREHARNVSAQ